MITLIVARAENNVIGCGGRIPWHIPGEQSRFRTLTAGGCVIMGRRTYEEIGRPLPGRLNVVVSSTADYRGENLLTVPTLDAALKAAGEKKTFICGGAELYREALPLCDVLDVTEIHAVVEGDTFFPAFDPKDYDFEEGETVTAVIPYTRTVYRRKTAGDSAGKEDINGCN